jgi:hypothetical protein
MITYADLLDRFSKQADDRMGSGGLLASQGEVNSSQGDESHDAKEKADLPDGKPSKLSFGSGKVQRGPEEQKINKTVFMTRGKSSTIKQAFINGFADEHEKLAGPRLALRRRLRGLVEGGKGLKAMDKKKRRKEIGGAIRSTAKAVPKVLSLAADKAKKLVGLKKKAFLEGFIDEFENQTG